MANYEFGWHWEIQWPHDFPNPPSYSSQRLCASSSSVAAAHEDPYNFASQPRDSDSGTAIATTSIALKPSSSVSSGMRLSRFPSALDRQRVALCPNGGPRTE
ncbi:hypothetical protein PIB30_006197 [Stylosanthes scabra]|uniref:Uncharacterized protein n=1 Tax=Stylosanthes scabra TaxID=79078 RepID=A0ABU6Y0V6_9FABA|nr:hypothetical protein [Stylosanthes scabra]